MCFFMYMERKKKEKKKGMRGTSKDLLHLEHKDSSASAIESALLVCSKKDKNESALLACSKKDTNVELKKQNPGKMPNYGPVPRSQGRHPA
ncbi:uncharacterized protein LOC112497171 isoform X5 [Citrus sinensis]|uniref:uncharacterized protein LOC112497171 isoform X6 n=1 Tax=Citrus sinensis TaxID=2711 RepID=UPI000D628EC0|nr:uncharacterized protein LOC112497171 isoform X6 [Citrus sinensis]XP_052289625.1 uncharacterized protein LOC112497171 isoform X5 [Citrus sinensis]